MKKMLFKRNGRSFKFCLLGLGYVQHAEISRLIIENGGEICDTGDPPTITFTDHDGYTGNEPVFHVKYIHECIRRARLLDLMHFKLGEPGFYGCLMSLFMYGKNSCSSIGRLGPCCSSAQVEPDGKSSPPIITEHSYAQGDADTVAESDVCSHMQQRAVNTLGPGSEFLLETSSQDPDLLTNENFSPGESDFLPSESSLPKYSHVLQEESYSPEDSDFAPDRTSSIIHVNNVRSEGNNITAGVPEVIRFEELSFVETYELPNPRLECPLNKSVPQECNYIAHCTERENENIVISESQTERQKEVELRTREDTRPCTNINEVHTQNVKDDVIETSDYIPLSIDKEEKTSLNVRLQRLRTSGVSNSHHTSSPVCGRKKMKRKLSTKNRAVCNQPVSDGPRVVISPIILRDESNQVKILGGGTLEALRKIEEFQLISSDSDDTIYEPELTRNDCEHRTIVDQSSQLESRKIVDAKKVPEPDKQIPGPSRANNTSENEVKTKSVNDKRSGGQSDVIDVSDEDDCALLAVKNTSRVPSDERSTVVTSTKPSNSVRLISDSDSSSGTESRAAGSSSRKVTQLKSSASLQGWKPSEKKARQNRPLTRNFLPWEQREMVKYLVSTNCIEEARGNNVWKQMIQDGFLTHRTYLSLNNHFRRYILPHIRRFSLKREHLKKFEKLLD